MANLWTKARQILRTLSRKEDKMPEESPSMLPLKDPPTTEESEEDFNEDWALLERRIPCAQTSPFQKDLDAAAKITQEELAKFVQNLGLVTLDGDTFGKITSRAIHVFLSSLQTTLRKRDLAGLLSLVLEGQGLSGPELKGFVRALPDKFLSRVLNSVLGTANGIQALMAIEWHFRQGNLSADYSLGVTAGGVVYAKIPQPNDEEVVLFLDDKFEETLLRAHR